MVQFFTILSATYEVKVDMDWQFSIKDLTIRDSFLGIILIGLTIGLGFFSEQNDFLSIIVFYVPFFLIYAFLLNEKKLGGNLKFFILGAIFLRFLLLFAFPNLSDDIYRFVWDGYLINNGLNPFTHLPKHYIENQILIDGITPELFQQLNSPEYFTIYPPVAQTLFAFAVWLFPNSVFWSAFVMKFFLFLCEIGTIIIIIQLLKRWSLPEKNVLIYALNPLIIIEITGNLHFEGAMVFFLLVAVWWILPPSRYLSGLKGERRFLAFSDEFKDIRSPFSPDSYREGGKLFLSALFFTFSIASKLLTLLFLPFFIKRLGLKKSIQYFSIIGILTLLIFFPLINGVFLENFGESLKLYFQKFEFNASVYYVARWIGFQVIGWNMIAVLGPALASYTVVGIIFFYLFDGGGKRKTFFKRISFFEKVDWKTLPGKMLFAICIYLFFTTTVHPWYLALPIVLCGFTKFRFPVIWSGLIFLTYINYNGSVYFENLWIVSIEYLIVFGYLIYELFFSPKIKTSPVSSPH